MRALVKTDTRAGSFGLYELPEPLPGPHEVRIKIKCAGICQTDILYVQEGGFALRPPVVLGHELSGVIDMLGEKVTGLQIGDRVLSQTTYRVCGKCRFCRRGEYNHCAERRGIGSAANGAFAEYVVVWENSVMKLPETMTFAQGACIEPVSCGVHALIERARCGPGDVVAVIGPGPIGLFAAQTAKAQGAVVVVAGRTQDAARLRIAKEKLKMDFVVDTQKEDLRVVCERHTGGYGADVVVEAAGAAEAVDLAMEVVARRGVFVPMGVFNRSIEVDFHNIKKKELTVYGSHAQIPTSWEKAMRLAALGKIDIDAVVSHIIPLGEWERAFAIVQGKQGLKVLLDMEA